MYHVCFQINKPITESPLLMSSYISHLTQLRCSNWNSNLPVLQGIYKKYILFLLVKDLKICLVFSLILENYPYNNANIEKTIQNCFR